MADNTSNVSATTDEPHRKQGRPRSAKAHKAILDATLCELQDKGFAALTVDSIAAKAGVSKATIYRRWPSKNALCLAAFDSLPEINVPDTGSIYEDLKTIMVQFLGFLETTPSMSALASLTEKRTHNPDIADALDLEMNRRREPLRTIVRRGITRGEIARSIDVELLIDAVMGPLLMRQLILASPAHKSNVQMVDALLHLVLKGAS